MIENQTIKVKFNCSGTTYTAYVRYYEDGSHDIEIEGDDAPAEVYDFAWDYLDKEGYLTECGWCGDSDGDYGDNV